jgi:superoxide dismutase, Fe-Mn family
MPAMKIESPRIPYNFSDLEPALSRDALVFHFLRHQRECFDRMRTLVRGTGLEALALPELVRVTARGRHQQLLHRYAAEVWSHNLYWRSMRPHGGGAPHGAVAALLGARFGSHQNFLREFREAANAHFGSGWLWLVWRAGTVEILTTANAGTPLTRGGVALLALDLWEHAYYLDHQNRRGAYVSAFLEDLVNWDFANRTLAEVLAGNEARAARPRGAAEAPRVTGLGMR